MTLDSYYYPSSSFDYSMFGAIAPATTTDLELPYSSIFDPEEDQQLLLDLQSFLSDSEIVNNSISPVYSDPYYYNFPVPHHTESALPPPLPHNYQFHLDFDYSSLFPVLPIVEEPFQLDPVLPEPADYNDYYFTEPAPKRQKCFHSSYTDQMTHFLAPPPPPPPQEIFPTPEKLCSCTKNAVSGGFESGDFSYKRKESGARATAQSVAARDRRKKISDKTQELGKLVPGASNSKMNTAEMLQHAFDYVKFLQTQVSVLQLMGSESSSQEDVKEEIKTGNLKILASRAVQEKLYMKEKCLVPVDLLEQLGENEDLKSQGLISKELKQLMESVSVENC